MILRVADSEKEPLRSVIDSDEVCFLPARSRIFKMIPVFNIIYPFWSDNNVQLDTVFESLKNCDALLPKLQSLENQGKKHIISGLVNINEEIGAIEIEPLKEMLILYKKYRDEAEIELKDSDLTYIKEYFCEFVRRMHFSEKTSRFNAVTFYENLGVADAMSKNNGRKFGGFCEVEIVETRTLDRYDLRWLTDVRPTCVFKEFFDAVNSYWKGEMTDNPKIEWLFSGKYLLKEMK